MNQYNSSNVKLPNLQLNKLKLGIKTATETTLKLSSNVVGDSNDEYNFSHESLLIDAKVSKLHKAFANGSTANINLLKTQLHKVELPGPGGFLGRLFGL